MLAGDISWLWGYKKSFLSFLSAPDSSTINSRPLVRQLFVAVSAPSSQYVGLFRALSLSSCIAGGERSGQVQAADCCGALSGVEALPLTSYTLRVRAARTGLYSSFLGFNIEKIRLAFQDVVIPRFGSQHACCMLGTSQHAARFRLRVCNCHYNTLQCHVRVT